MARVCAGITGGGIYSVLPIFIGEIADSRLVEHTPAGLANQSADVFFLQCPR